MENTINLELYTQQKYPPKSKVKYRYFRSTESKDNSLSADVHHMN
jgi:hypothetical protein